MSIHVKWKANRESIPQTNDYEVNDWGRGNRVAYIYMHVPHVEGRIVDNIHRNTKEGSAAYVRMPDNYLMSMSDEWSRKGIGEIATAVHICTVWSASICVSLWVPRYMRIGTILTVDAILKNGSYAATEVRMFEGSAAMDLRIRTECISINIFIWQFQLFPDACLGFDAQDGNRCMEILACPPGSNNVVLRIRCGARI